MSKNSCNRNAAFREQMSVVSSANKEVRTRYSYLEIAVARKRVMAGMYIVNRVIKGFCMLGLLLRGKIAVSIIRNFFLHFTFRAMRLHRDMDKMRQENLYHPFTTY